MIRRRSVCGLAPLLALALVPGWAAAEPKPRVESRAALLLDGASGRTLFASNQDEKLAIASLTKLMTALLAIEQLDLNSRVVAASYDPQSAESQIELRPGEVMSVRDLLKALLLESANDAAATLAEATAGSVPKFVKLMNRRARGLGLSDTHFANPIGLDQRGNYSSAADLAKLTHRLLESDFARRTVALPRARLVSGQRVRVVENRNELVRRYRFVKGVKTGHTAEAAYSLVGSADRRGMSLISVVLGAPTEQARNTGTLNLFQYAFTYFVNLSPVRRGRVYAQTEVRNRGDEVKLVASESLDVVVPRGEKLSVRVQAPREVSSTIDGKALGKVTAVLDGRQISTAELVASKTVTKAGPVAILFYYLTRPLTLLAIAVILLVVLYLGPRFARRGSGTQNRSRAQLS